MRKLEVLCFGLILLAAIVFGTDWLMQRAATARRSDSDRAAAIAAVVKAEPSVRDGSLTVPFWNPSGSDVSEVQVQRTDDPSSAWNVTVRWDAAARKSTAVSIAVVAPK